MLTEEFLPHFLSVVLSSKYWLHGVRGGGGKSLGIQKFTRLHHPVQQISLQLSLPNTHNLSKTLLYMPASWVVYLQKGKTFIIFALLVSSVVTVSPPALGSETDSQSKRDFLD